MSWHRKQWLTTAAAGAGLAFGIPALGNFAGLGALAEAAPGISGAIDLIGGALPSLDTLSKVGTAAGGALGYLGAKQTNIANAQQAQNMIDFQRQQSQTGYQRATGDLRAAGLNPMLAYSQGPEGSGPGAQATMVNEKQAGMASAVQAATAMAGLKNTAADTTLKDYTSDNLAQKTRESKAQELLLQADALKVAKDTDVSVASAKQINQLVTNLKEQLKQLQISNTLSGSTLPTDIRSNTLAYKREQLQYMIEKLGLPEHEAKYRAMTDDSGQHLGRYSTTAAWLKMMNPLATHAGSAAQIIRATHGAPTYNFNR